MSESPDLGALSVWQSLVDTDAGRALVTRIEAELGPDGTPDAHQVGGWRKRHDAETVRCAIDLVRGRRASAPKFREPDPVVDRSGVEQASAWRVAAWKAGRVASDAPHVLDLCCGAGADACELMRAGATVHAVDLDPVRAWMCAQNARCEAVAEDVTTLDTTGCVVHLDPARREEAGRAGGRGARLHGLDALRPAFDTVCALTDHAAGSAVKLGPGTDADPLLTHDRESVVSYVSLAGRMREAVWWRAGLTNTLQPGAVVEAVILNNDAVATVAGVPDTTDTRAPIGSVVYAVDASIERARLIHTLAGSNGLTVVHPALGLLTGEGPPARHDAWTAYTVSEVMPWRRERVREWLKEHGAGIVTVKTRAKACDPDVEQRALRHTGETPFTVFVLRFDEAVRAIIAQRADAT